MSKTELESWLDRLNPHIGLCILNGIEDRLDRHVFLNLKLELLRKTLLNDEHQKICAELGLKSKLDGYEQVCKSLGTLRADVIKLIKGIDKESEKSGVDERSWSVIIEYAKQLYELGQYQEAMECCHTVISKCSDIDTVIDALWGGLSTAILLKEWDVAGQLFDQISRSIPRSGDVIQLKNLRKQCYLGLFLFRDHPKGVEIAIAHFFSPETVSMVQLGTTHLTRYIVSAVLCSDQRQKMIRKLVDVFKYEVKILNNDPLVDVMRNTCFEYNFYPDFGVLDECIQSDYFLSRFDGRIQDGIRRTILEIQLLFHRRISTTLLLDQLKLGQETDVEEWLKQSISGLGIEFVLDQGCVSI